MHRVKPIIGPASPTLGHFGPYTYRHICTYTCIHTHLCQLCSCYYTAKQIKNCTKSTSVTKVATMKKWMVPAAPVKGVIPIIYRLKSEVSMFNLLHCRNCLKTSNWSSSCEKYGRCRAPIIVWKWSITLLCELRMFNSLHSNMNQDLCSISVIKVATMKISITQWKPSNHQIDTFCCQQR